MITTSAFQGFANDLCLFFDHCIDDGVSNKITLAFKDYARTRSWTMNVFRNPDHDHGHDTHQRRETTDTLLGLRLAKRTRAFQELPQEAQRA